ncbi:hypothetical protein M434DRAFT_34813 [Hypoxylon sp. CO27-5]|nr:hypothetical protein M434DRAFT_34813 [Hypoxylon sp. CO27-5]
MDPISVLQIVSTAISIGDVVVRCITRLGSLKAKYSDAPIHFSTMIGQLYMVQAALDQLSVLRSPGLCLNPKYPKLANQITKALDSFGPVMETLQRDLSRLDDSIPSEMTTRSRLAFLWSEKEILAFSTALDRQVNALNLLLQTIQCQTWIQQQEAIGLEESRSMLNLARDCSSSTMGLDDKSSFMSEGSAAISTIFDFDAVVLNTRLYREAQRSHLKQVIRARNLLKAHNPQASLPRDRVSLITNERSEEESEGRIPAQPPVGEFMGVVELDRIPSASQSTEPGLASNQSQSESSSSSSSERPSWGGLVHRSKPFQLVKWLKAFQRGEFGVIIKSKI